MTSSWFTARRGLALLAGLVTVGSVLAAPVPAGAAGPATTALRTVIAPFGCQHVRSTRVVSCFGKMIATRTAAGVLSPKTTTAPKGYGPADIQSAYNLAGTSATGKTVAIVDAYNDPNAEQDLATYRSHYGLPACTTANGCFKKVNQNGASTPMPSTDYGWGLEISLDLDMVSAACPSCNILLVEANSATDTDLYKAVDTAAAAPGVVAISNSYGGAEASTQTADDAHFNHPGIAITASSGDSGYGVSYPAASQYVTAVGGTSLSKASNARGWTETAWSGAGSGCSAYDPKPSWQTDTGCTKRTVADVSAVADPNTGVAVYDTANSCGTSSFCDYLISVGVVQGADGWVQVGGTSASSPIIASVYALGGHSSASWTYAHTASLNDVTSGSNGSCSGSYLCTAKAGYDGPTGLGTPNGTGAF
ncbi:MAG TPA: S53 family peptidase [Jatrophihabitans sp.]|jgi:subtilase family serine protease